MLQIPQNTIDKIRDQADIVDVISREVELKRKGVNYFGICPFHDEKTPSFSVSQSKQIYKCFGGCDAGGNVFTFIMEFYKLTFFESAKLLADRYNIILDISDNYSSSNEYSFLKVVHEDASLIFQQNLFSDIGKEPLQYLKKRNLTEEIIRKFRIGFAIDSWNGLIKKIGPKYNNETVDSKVGLEFQGDSKNKEKGNKKITDHKVVEVVTFSLTLFLSLRVNKPPMQ